jgi:hypothetical protein
VQATSVTSCPGQPFRGSICAWLRYYRTNRSTPSLPLRQALGHRVLMKTKYHINVIILFEFIIPFLPILWVIFTQSNLGFGPTLISILSLHILGRIISRNIPASCDSCAEKVKPRGTYIIYYNCAKCGFKYSKTFNASTNFHND